MMNDEILASFEGKFRILGSKKSKDISGFKPRIDERSEGTKKIEDAEGNRSWLSRGHLVLGLPGLVAASLLLPGHWTPHGPWKWDMDVDDREDGCQPPF